jgi:sulfur relay (sulfurtransferase) complex TusBCD TusD component (DsrE family)
MGKNKFGILLSTREHQDFNTVVSLAQEAVRQEILVYLYFLDDGVYHLGRPEILSLADSGVRIFACAYGAQRRGVPQNNFVVFSGLVVLSDIVKGCDRFISFN